MGRALDIETSEVPSVGLAASPYTVQSATPTATHYRWAAIGLVAFTIYGALLPFQFTPMPLPEAVAAFRQLVLWDPSDPGARGDWVVSICQYAVVSYALAAAICCDRARAWDILGVLLVIPACAVLIIGTEFLQIFFPPRTVSVNDIVVESAGGALGIAAWVLMGRRVTTWARRLGGANSFADLAGLLLPAYVAALVVVELMPFDFVLSQDELASKIAGGMVRLAPFGGSWDSAEIGIAVLTILAFLPWGFLPVLAGRRFDQQGAEPFGLGIALLGPAVIEALRLFVYSRSFEANHIVFGTIGVSVGWWLGRGIRIKSLAVWAAPPRPRILWLALGAAWFGTVLYLNWRPFDFTADPTRLGGSSDEASAVGVRYITWAPFVDYYWNSKYGALDQFIFKGLSFFPLGALLAMSSREIYGPGTIRRVVLPVAAAAFVVEAGRYFLPNHFPSVTDVLIQAAGAWIGFTMTRLIRAVVWAEAKVYGWLPPLSPPLHFIFRPSDILTLSHPRQHRG